jgi:hypothetical protein
MNLLNRLKKTYTKLISSANYFDYIDKLKRYRRALLERFPCMVIYEIENNNVIIVAVRYSAENPSKYQQFVR